LQSDDQSQGEDDIGQSSNSNNRHDGDGDNDGDSGQKGKALSPSSAPTARSLLENMSTMTRLTRFSLTDRTETNPEWIVLEIVCHCPL